MRTIDQLMLESPIILVLKLLYELVFPINPRYEPVEDEALPTLSGSPMQGGRVAVLHLLAKAATPGLKLGDHHLEVLQFLDRDVGEVLDKLGVLRVLCDQRVGRRGGLQLAVGVILEEPRGLSLNERDPGPRGLMVQRKSHRSRRCGLRGVVVPNRNPQPFWPGTQSTSLLPPSLASRARTKKRSESRFTYFRTSAFTRPPSSRAKSSTIERSVRRQTVRAM